MTQILKIMRHAACYTAPFSKEDKILIKKHKKANLHEN